MRDRQLNCNRGIPEHVVNTYILGNVFDNRCVTFTIAAYFRKRRERERERERERKEERHKKEEKGDPGLYVHTYRPGSIIDDKCVILIIATYSCKRQDRQEKKK